jgi:hypothetical protein
MAMTALAEPELETEQTSDKSCQWVTTMIMYYADGTKETENVWMCTQPAVVTLHTICADCGGADSQRLCQEHWERTRKPGTFEVICLRCGSNKPPVVEVETKG